MALPMATGETTLPVDERTRMLLVMLREPK
jgi:hypothetical protein